MKKLPAQPYLANISQHYSSLYPEELPGLDGGRYRDWLGQFGFQVPVQNKTLEFPKDFPDTELALFVLKWG